MNDTRIDSFSPAAGDRRFTEELAANASQAGAQLKEAGLQGYESARAALSEMGSAARVRAREASDRARGYVGRNPWTAVLAGLALGAAIGWVVARR